MIIYRRATAHNCESIQLKQKVEINLQVFACIFLTHEHQEA